MATLEAEIGFKLFQRTGRGVETTERGRSFLAEAGRVADEFYGLTDTARRLNGAGFETFTLGMGSGMAGLVAPRGLAHFAEIFPNVRLQIVTAPTRRIYEQLHSERLDVGVAIELPREEVPTGLATEAIATADMVLIGPTGHPLLAGSGPLDLALLIGEPLIANELAIGYGQIVMSMFTDIGVRPNLRAIADNVDTLKEMVAAGLGVALVPRSAVTLTGPSSPVALREIKPARRIGFCLVRRRQAMSRNRESYYAFLSEALAQPR